MAKLTICLTLLGLLANSYAVDRQRIAAPADLIWVPQPIYPKSARYLNQTGTVVLIIRVLRNGTVALVLLERSSGIASLDEAAINAMRRSRWTPALGNDGQPTDSTLVLPIQFGLSD